MIKNNWAFNNSKIVRNVDKMTLRMADLVYWWVINSVHMLGTSVAVTCHRICEMTAVWFPRRSLEALREEGRLLGFVSSCCPQPRWLELRSIPHPQCELLTVWGPPGCSLCYQQTSLATSWSLPVRCKCRVQKQLPKCGEELRKNWSPADQGPTQTRGETQGHPNVSWGIGKLPQIYEGSPQETWSWQKAMA